MPSGSAMPACWMRPSVARTTGPAAAICGWLAVADQAGEPVVGEPGGGRLHEMQVLGRGGVGCGR